MKVNVTISVSEYEELLEMAEKLEALESMGVDNWSGYGEAMSLLDDDEDDDDED